MTMFLITAFSILAAGLSIASLRYYFKKNMVHFWAWSSASIIVILMFTLIIVMPVLDRFKSFVPFCRQVKTLASPDKPLFGYMPDETLRGVVPFYTGYYFKETDSKDYLAEMAEKYGQIFVVIRDSRGKLENELLSTGRFSVLFRQGLKTDRSLVLLTNRRDRELALRVPESYKFATCNLYDSIPQNAK